MSNVVHQLKLMKAIKYFNGIFNEVVDGWIYNCSCVHREKLAANHTNKVEPRHCVNSSLPQKAATGKETK